MKTSFFKDNKNDFKRTNIDGTKKLAVQAIKAGVKHFIFLSSIKVYGDNSTGTDIFTE